MLALRGSHLLLTAACWPLATHAAEIVAGPPSDLSVTVYRAPWRDSGALSLASLNGFALISETRSVSIPKGDSEIRFEGVADGIEPASALVTGLPAEILEKNRDAQLLSPSELVAASVGKRVALIRTDSKSGRSTRTTGTIRSDAGGGVVFEGPDGIEALRCSGLPETFQFSDRTRLLATPTLSVRVRSASAASAQVTLSYLSRGFDWAANYVLSVAPGGASMDLGGWVTLANGNGTRFEAAHTQVVAGRLNRTSGEVEPISLGGPILAQCWPRGTTSDVDVVAPRQLMLEAPMAAAAPAAEIFRKSARALTAELVQQEQLGDLKLYRVPERTSVGSRQMKQVRLLDRSSVPIAILHIAELPIDQTLPVFPARRTLQTVNDSGHHLGLPLPSGQIASFEASHASLLLLDESPLRDTATGEALEIDAGASPDVQIEQVHEQSTVGAAQNLPLLPGVEHLRSEDVHELTRIEIHNARAARTEVQIRLQIPDSIQLVAADHAVSSRHDKPVFDLTLESGESATIRYRTARVVTRVVPR